MTSPNFRIILLAAAAAYYLPGAELKLPGLTSYQVIQRDASGKGAVAVPGDVKAKVTGPQGVVVGAVAKGGRIAGIPTGGPYRIELSAGSASAVVDHVYVGDLWLLAGQSNMVGRASLETAEKPDESIHVWRPSGGWAVAKEPLHESRIGFKGVIVGAGLGLPFAKELLRRTGVPIGLVPTAVGATSLWEWHPDLIQGGPKDYYTPMLRQFQGAGGKVKGVLWYQGEADCRDDRAPSYLVQFQSFIARVRTDLGDPVLPFYFVQLGRTSNEEPPPRNDQGWSRVREAQRLAELSVPNTGMVSAIDVEMEDAVHMDTDGLKRIGRRLALVACANLFPKSCPGAKTGPRFESATWDSDRRLRVRFSNVNGALTANGRLLGFGLYGQNQKLRRVIYRAWIPQQPGNDVILEVNHQWAIPEPLILRYGESMDPACNLRDKADMAAPTFGPIPVPPRPAAPKP